MIRVVNIVLLFTFNREICPDELGEFQVKYLVRFHSGIVSFGKLRMNVFFSGKAIVTGIQKELTGVQFVESFRKQLVKPLEVVGWKIVNITGADTLDFKPNITKLCEHPAVTYEPELFNALYYREEGSKVVIIVFHSGKLIVTGAITIRELRTTYRNFLKETETYIKRQ